MTNEEAIKILKEQCYVFDALNLDYTIMVNTALDMAIEALERSEKFQQKAEVVISQLRADRDRLEDAIEKIRSEIESHIIDSNGLDFNSALCIAVEIIDKYKTETGS